MRALQNHDFRRKPAFIFLLEPGSSILDAGCGSGRDSNFFLESGFHVQAMDASREMCALAEEYIGQSVGCMRFDGIWTCLSLLHLEKSQLPDLLCQFHQALKSGGIMYASFKNGNTEEERLERFFSDYHLGEIERIFTQDGLFALVEGDGTEDVRPDYQNKPWINIIVRKKLQ